MGREMLYSDDPDFEKEIIWKGPFTGFYPENRGAKRQVTKGPKKGFRQRAILVRMDNELHGGETASDLARLINDTAVWGRLEYGNDHGGEGFHQMLINTLTLAQRLLLDKYPETREPPVRRIIRRRGNVDGHQ